MATVDVAPGVYWLLIAVLGVGTYVLRLSFIQVHAWIEEFPPVVENALAFVPAAILAALVFPEVLSAGGSTVDGFVSPRLAAGVLAAIVAWRTGSMIATIGVGMLVLWTARLLLG